MADVQPPVPPDVWASILSPLASGATGLLLRYAQKWKPGQLIAWRQLFVDSWVIAGGYFLGPGLAEIMGWGDRAGNALSLGFGYFGVRVLDSLWASLQAKITDKVPT